MPEYDEFSRGNGGRTIHVVSSRVGASRGFERGPFDYKNLIGAEVERGVTAEVANYRAVYADEIIKLVRPRLLTTDMIRFVMDELRTIRPGERLDPTALEEIAAYLRERDAPPTAIEVAEGVEEVGGNALLWLSPDALFRHLVRRGGQDPGAFAFRSVDYVESPMVGDAGQGNFLAFAYAGDGVLHEFRFWPEREVLKLSQHPAPEVQDGGDPIQGLLSLGQILKIASAHHPYFSPSWPEPVIRAVRFGFMRTPMTAHLPPLPLAVALAGNAQNAVLLAFSATSGALVYSLVLPAGVVPANAILLASWMTALTKIIELICDVMLVAAAIAGAVAGAPTVVVSLLAAAVLIAALLKLIIDIIDALMELTQPPKPGLAEILARIRQIMARRDEIEKKLKDGSMTPEKGADELEKQKKDLEKAAKDLEALLNEQEQEQFKEFIKQLLDGIGGVSIPKPVPSPP